MRGKGRRGIHGDYPILTDLNDGLPIHTEFRSVYAALLDRWLQTPSSPVLGGNFPYRNFV